MALTADIINNLINIKNEKNLKLSSLITDQKRTDSLIKQCLGINLDISKQLIDLDILDELINIIEKSNLKNSIEQLCNGQYKNITENRNVEHVLLRAKNSIDTIKAQLDKMESFVENFYLDNKYTDIIHIGIGGSDLGPRLFISALDNYKKDNAPNIHFISNVDAYTINKIINKVEPAKTLVIISSKSFSTIETITIAKYIKEWLGANHSEQMIAITSNKSAAVDFGVNNLNIFEFWESIGGRYSIWSAIGLPVAISIGMNNFKNILAGANELDEHFATTEFKNNLPVLLALIGIWNINVCGLDTHCVIPYCDRLELLPSYLQQLEMESNGKSLRVENNNLEIKNNTESNNDDSNIDTAIDKNTNLNSNTLDYKTSSILWGGVGCNSQHSYMQLLHQGTTTSPIDFIVIDNNEYNNLNNNNPNNIDNNNEKILNSDLIKLDINSKNNLHNILINSAKGQAKALAVGNSDIKTTNDDDFCIGNKPSSMITLQELSPQNLGALIALYEHKVFVQSHIWGISAFDQWGVQLGKEIINQYMYQKT